ncbi:52 kDa repressor of the inhibitor of the protein kinase-like [Macrobrachium rosenbergii]|uniref:52 kDa repressor of the inhibitor of the protein kinase-like n=1 Tax=Macrobrachium rosenbergii TaxID=79674 RepID=UPI0034D59D11
MSLNPVLTPSVQCNDDIDIDLMPAAAELYKDDDLPSPELVPQELKRWKLKCKLLSKDSMPLTCAKAIKMCDPSMFPNICTLLKIACTLSVTSCECEKSASTLRRLNAFMRANMKEERLSSLALIHTNYNMPTDLDKAEDIFSKLHPRRLELTSVFT